MAACRRCRRPPVRVTAAPPPSWIRASAYSDLKRFEQPRKSDWQPALNAGASQSSGATDFPSTACAHREGSAPRDPVTFLPSEPGRVLLSHGMGRNCDWTSESPSGAGCPDRTREQDGPFHSDEGFGSSSRWKASGPLGDPNPSLRSRLGKSPPYSNRHPLLPSILTAPTERRPRAHPESRRSGTGRRAGRHPWGGASSRCDPPGLRRPASPLGFGERPSLERV